VAVVIAVVPCDRKSPLRGIRTFAEIPIEEAILDAGTPPIYRQIAPKAFQLQQVGMSSLGSAKRIGVLFDALSALVPSVTLGYAIEA